MRTFKIYLDDKEIATLDGESTSGELLDFGKRHNYTFVSESYSVGKRNLFRFDETIYHFETNSKGDIKK